MLPADIEWALDLACLHYAGRFDREGVKTWAHARMQNEDMIFLRTDHAFGAAHLAERYMAPGHQQAFLTLLYAEPGNYGRDILRLIEALKQWAQDKGATKFWGGDITGHNLRAVFEMVGGRLAGHTYVVDLDEDPLALG